MGYSVFQIICNLAISLLLLSFSVSGNTNRSDHNCIPQIKVSRNTVFKARVMKDLKINCTVTLRGCHRNLKISWCKISGNDCKALNHSDYIKTELKNTGDHEWMAFLNFLNISMEDAGFYRCKEGDMSVSHAINVTVTDKKDEVSHNQSNTGDLNTVSNDDQQWLWPYVYICSGIAGLVFIVMTVSLLFIRCQGTKSTRKDVANKNQYLRTQNSDLPPLPPPPHPHHNTRPPSDRPTSASYRVCETLPVRGTPSAGRVSDVRYNTVGRGEEENVLVYASLNHQATSRGPRRTARQEPEPEPSEYAAIRFR